MRGQVCPTFMLSPTHQCLSHTRNLILFKVKALSFSLILGKEITQQTKLVLIHLWHLSPVTFWMSVAIKSKLICKHTTVVDFCPRSHAAEWLFHVTRLENPLTRLCYAPHPPSLYGVTEISCFRPALTRGCCPVWNFLWDRSLDVQTIKECPLSKCPEDLIFTTSMTPPLSLPCKILVLYKCVQCPWTSHWNVRYLHM